MSTTGSFDSYNSPNTQTTGGSIGNTDEAQIDEVSAGGEGHGPGMFSGGIGNFTQSATQAAKQGADAVVNAGKSIVEMGGSVISGLKRGFSKTSETGGE